MKYNDAPVSWLFKMAWRDGRSGLKRLLLFMSSIVLGIGALVALQSFGDTLTANIALQSKELMGADLLVDSEQLPNEIVQGMLDSIPAEQKARDINFVSMASFPGKKGSKLVRVRGVEGSYPFYGELRTLPESAATAYQTEEFALVDASLMLQYKLAVGDSIQLGEKRFMIGGVLKKFPGNTEVSTSIAPTVFIPYASVEATKLIQMGSRQEYNFYFQVPEGSDLQNLYDVYDSRLDEQGADMDLHTDTSARLGRRFDNVGRFLNLVAFVALLLGCLGIASSIQIYMREKKVSLAVLKCLGATRRQTFGIFLIQLAAIGLLGGLVGVLLGFALQRIFPLFIADFLPVELEFTFSVFPLLTGLCLGMVMAVLFGLLPLLNTWHISPLQALRVSEGKSDPSLKSRILVVTLILVFIFGFSFFILERIAVALGFVVVLLAATGIIAGIAWLFMKGLKKYFPKGLGYTTRQSLLNLFRPNNQTQVLLLSIGIGTFLLSTLYFTQDMLLVRAELEDDANSANLILLDVQTNQEKEIQQTLIPQGYPVIDNIPIVTMRMDKIKDRMVSDLRKDTTTTINPWILNHEFRVTYRDSLISSEKLTSGEWISTFEMGSGPVPISMSDNVAMDAQVGLGDTLIFNVQGVRMETFVASIREVDWGRVQLNFSIVFPRGVLEDAPQFMVMSTFAENTARAASIQQVLVEKFPNVTVLDLQQILSLVQDILDKIAWVIRFMAFFSILTGFIVLIGAVRTSKFQRMRENVLLRTLGAKGGQLVRITTLEYGFLGLIGSVLGVLLALLGSQLLALWFFETTFTPSFVPFLVIIPSVTLTVILIGILNSIEVLRTPPLEVLRKEGV